MPLCKLAYRCLLRKEKKNEKKNTGEKERRMKKSLYFDLDCVHLSTRSWF